MWLKDIKIHIKDHNLMWREAIQLVKGFTAGHALDEVEFYMGMVLEGEQTFVGLVEHHKKAF